MRRLLNIPALFLVPTLFALLVLAGCGDDSGSAEDVMEDSEDMTGDVEQDTPGDTGDDTSDDMGDDTADDTMDTTGDMPGDTQQDMEDDTTDMVEDTMDMMDMMDPELPITFPMDPQDYMTDTVVFLDTLRFPDLDGNGDATCCKDFGNLSKDPGIDNALGELLRGPLDGAVMVNSALDQSIQSGGLLVLFDHKLLDSTDDADGFVLTAFAGDFEGTTTYTEAAAGTGTFNIEPESFVMNTGRPITVFNPAAMQMASMTAGPDDFFLTVPLGGAVLDIPLLSAELTGDVTNVGGMGQGLQLEYANGTISGYIESADFRDAVNAFVDSECGCLGLSGPLFAENDSWSPNQCMTQQAAEAACPNPSPNEQGCITLVGGTVCNGLPLLITTFADIDPKGGANYTALSVGLEFTAVPAEVIGVLP